MGVQMSMSGRVKAEACVSLAEAPTPSPFVYRVNGGAPHVLRGWGHAQDLLCLIGLHESLSFVLFERAAGGDRWVQALGAPERMVVEVAAGDGPMRVGRRVVDSPRDDVLSVQGFRVGARAAELWTAQAAAAITRSWLVAGSLPDLDAELVPPVDWPG